MTHVVKEDVPENTVVAQIKEHSLEYRGVQVEASYLRQYPVRGVSAPTCWATWARSPRTISTTRSSPTLRSGATLGKDGVECKYDSFLRGTDGWKTVEVDAAGRPKQFLEERRPDPGKNLVLTIDSDLQKAAEESLAQGIQARAGGELSRRPLAGAVVAMDPSTGEILALASYPDYDPSLWVGGMKQTKYAELNAPQAHNPLFDRVIDGLYPAGLHVQAVRRRHGAQRRHSSTRTRSSIAPASSPSMGRPGRTGTRRPHGNVNLLFRPWRNRCDVYFYNVGNLMYQQPSPVLQNGVRQFGFGQPTGIDLPGRYQQPRARQVLEEPRPARPRRTRSGRRGTRSTWPSGKATCWSPPADGRRPLCHRQRRDAVGAAPRAPHHRRLRTTLSTSSKARSGASLG